MKSLFLTERIGYPGKSDTNLLIKESVRRFETFAFETTDLFIENGIAKANCRKVSIDEKGEPKASDEIFKLTLAEKTIVTIRLNPPFDSQYLTAMYMLRGVGKGCYVTNNPQGIINLPEKFIPDELQRFTPPTLISRDEGEILSFFKKHEDIVMKPLYDFGGNGVLRIKKDDENPASAIRSTIAEHKEHVIAQKYIHEVTKGDKRIGLIDGEIYGHFLRIPPEGQLQAAVIRGGSFVKCELTEREKEICAILKPIMLENDIFLCGFDMIGDYLTEINVTCPAIFFCMNELYKNDAGFIPSEKIYWDKLETKLKGII